MNQSVVWDRATGITVESRPEPTATAGHVVLRVDASGLCGADLHIAAGEYPLAKSPVVLGHEYAGTIVEIGAGVQGWQVGDRVVVDPNIPCGGCRFCHDAKPHLCASRVSRGDDRWRHGAILRRPGLPHLSGPGRALNDRRRTDRTSRVRIARGRSRQSPRR